jgi:hypothetical protein
MSETKFQTDAEPQGKITLLDIQILSFLNSRQNGKVIHQMVENIKPIQSPLNVLLKQIFEL